MSSRYYSAQAIAARSSNSDPESGILSDTSSNPTTKQKASGEGEAQDAELVDIRSRCSSTSPPPPPPLPPNVTCTTIGPGTTTTASLNASRISVVKWPQGSIPRRVKKLTWEDETKTSPADDHSQNSGLVSHISSSQVTCDSQDASSSHSSPCNAVPDSHKSTVTTGVGQGVCGMPAIAASSPTPGMRESVVDSFKRSVAQANGLASGLPDLTVYF